MTRRTLVFLCALIAFAVPYYVFTPVLDAEFTNWDDPMNYFSNTAYRGLGSEQLTWMFTTNHLGHYQPLTWLTYAIDYVIGSRPGTDPNPGRWHHTSLLWHCGAATAVFFAILALLARAMPERRERKALVLGALAGALLFAIHPLRAEPVAWQSARGFVICGFFYALTIAFYLYATDGGTARRRWFLLSFLCCSLAWLAREWAVTLPIVLLILDVYPLRRARISLSPKVMWQQWFPRFVEKVPYFVLSLGGAVLGYWARQRNEFLHTFEDHSIFTRVMQSLQHLAFYVQKTFWPFDLSPVYLERYNFSPTEPRFFIAAAIIIGLSLLFLVLRKRFPALLTAWFVYLLILAPVVGVAQSALHIAADRYSYFAMLPLAVLGGAAVARYGPRMPAFTWFYVGVLTVVLGMMSWRQADTWKNSTSLWNHALLIDDTNAIALVNRGELLRIAGQEETDKERQRALNARAQRLFQAAVKNNPGFSHGYNNLGIIHMFNEEYDLAEAAFLMAYERSSDKTPAMQNLGLIYAGQGEFEKALKYYDAILSSNPDRAEALHNRGKVYVQQEKFKEAINDFNRAIMLKPDISIFYVDRGMLLRKQGHGEEAAQDFERSVRLDASWVDYYREQGILK